ncbi:response regulator [Acanthopleuribacter pedis]|uniref:Response regulator n=1 Tax=Acanthopleuribacter pedis TaxID=442870 RepID=A0A8J7U402_9BACT|nr:response regulator [Acanthopleuribacter pedis]MBO1318853.1 response regulator [Acanthopleuribacter pedis]
MGKRILLADDSATIQKLVEMALDDTDYQLTCVSDGQAAVNQLPQVEPHLVLADAIMPFLDGYQVCERIKSDPRFEHIPVVLLTGRFQPFNEALAQQVKIDERVVKPFSQEQLIALIERYVTSDAPAEQDGELSVAPPPGDLSLAEGEEDSVIDRAEISFADLDVGSMDPVAEDAPEAMGGLADMGGEGVDSTLRINPETLRAEAEALRNSVHHEEGSVDDTDELTPGEPADADETDEPFGDVGSFGDFSAESDLVEETPAPPLDETALEDAPLDETALEDAPLDETALEDAPEEPALAEEHEASLLDDSQDKSLDLDESEAEEEPGLGFEEDDFLPREMPVTEPIPVVADEAVASEEAPEDAEDAVLDASMPPDDSLEALDELDEIEELEDEMIAYDDLESADDLDAPVETDEREAAPPDEREAAPPDEREAAPPDEGEAAPPVATEGGTPPDEDRFLPLEQPSPMDDYVPPPESEREYLPVRDFSEEDTMELTTADLEEAGLDDLAETELQDIEPEPLPSLSAPNEEAIELDDADLVDEASAVDQEETQPVERGGEDYDTAPVAAESPAANDEDDLPMVALDEPMASESEIAEDDEEDALAGTLDESVDAEGLDSLDEIDDIEGLDELDELDEIDETEETDASDELDPGDALAASLDQADESLELDTRDSDPFVAAPLDLGADATPVEVTESVLEDPNEDDVLAVEEIEPPLMSDAVEDVSALAEPDTNGLLDEAPLDAALDEGPLDASLEEDEDLLDLDEASTEAPAPEPVAPEPVAVTAPAEPAPAAAPALSAASLDEKQLDLLADKVAERLLNTDVPQSIREIVWQVVPELAEAMIKKRIYQLEQSVDDE